MVVIEEAEHQMLLSLTDGHLGQDNYSLLILEALLSSKLMQRTKMEVLQIVHRIQTGAKDKFVLNPESGAKREEKTSITILTL